MYSVALEHYCPVIRNTLQTTHLVQQVLDMDGVDELSASAALNLVTGRITTHMICSGNDLGVLRALEKIRMAFVEGMTRGPTRTSRSSSLKGA